MKPERIQLRLGEKLEWGPAPATIERRWDSNSFLDSARLARVVHNTLVDSPVRKEVFTADHEVRVRLFLETAVFAEALFNARDQIDVAVAEAGF